MIIKRSQWVWGITGVVVAILVVIFVNKFYWDGESQTNSEMPLQQKNKASSNLSSKALDTEKKPKNSQIVTQISTQVVTMSNSKR